MTGETAPCSTQRWREGTATLCRAVRGAITVECDEPALVCAATAKLLTALLHVNGLEVRDVISAFFTATPDLRSVFPARAARDMGWDAVPLLCAVEMDVPEMLPRVLRVLLHVEWPAGAEAPQAVYMRDAARLRPEYAYQETGAMSRRAPGTLTPARTSVCNG